VLLEGNGSNDRPLGNLEATIDWDLAYIAFYERALMIFAAAFALSTVLAFILVAAFHLALTRPLTRLAHTLSELGLDEAGQTFVPDIHGHRRDELGRIVRVVNNFIEATARHAAERDASAALSNRCPLPSF
jgi:methyl-accepting chemotaxis protein